MSVKSKSKKPLFQKKLQNTKKTHFLSALKVKYVDYKNIKLLTQFVSVFERILPARITGVKVKHQRMVAKAIKRARYMALLPYIPSHNTPHKERKF